MKIRLTDLTVRRLKPPASGRLEVFDQHLPSFGIRVSASGVRSFFVLGRIAGSPQLRRWTLGRADAMSLSEARAKARIILADLASGVDPEIAARRRQVVTVRSAVAEYASRRLNGLRSATAVRQLLERELVATFGDMPIRNLTRADVIHLVEDVSATRPVLGNRLLSNIRRLLEWCTERGAVDANCAAGIRPPARECSRELTARLAGL